MKKKTVLCQFGAASLIAGSFLALSTAAPAGAESAELDYTCGVPLLGDQTFTAQVDTDAPETMEVGQSVPINVTSAVTVPAALAELLGGLGPEIDGNAVVTSLVNGVENTSTLTVPRTPTSDSGPLLVNAAGAGGDLSATEEGDLVIEAGNFTTTIHVYDADGEEVILDGILPATVNCALDAGQDATVDTVTVTASSTDPDPDPDPEPEPGDDGEQGNGGTSQVPTVVTSGR